MNIRLLNLQQNMSLFFQGKHYKLIKLSKKTLPTYGCAKTKRTLNRQMNQLKTSKHTCGPTHLKLMLKIKRVPLESSGAGLNVARVRGSPRADLPLGKHRQLPGAPRFPGAPKRLMKAD